MNIAKLAIIGMVCVAAAPAWAQQRQPPPDEKQTGGEGELRTVPVREGQPEAPPPGDAPTFDTIEVTAQRRTERLIDVPLAVTAMSMDQIEVRDITRLDDLNALAPGFQVSRSPSNTTISQLTMRASSQINPAIYWDPAVGVYLDGAYIGKSQGAIFDIVDLAGVEVLRGPQGTLYGRNTIGGAVNFITREPSGTFNGTVTSEFGDFKGSVYRASIDTPRLWLGFDEARLGGLDMTFGVRSERRDPWVITTPASPVPGMNNRHSDGAHFAARLDVTEGVEVKYTLDWTETDQTNNFLQLVRSDNPDPDVQREVSRNRRETASINALSSERADITGHAFTVEWQFSELLGIKSISGYRDVTWIDQLDLDGTPEDIAHSARFTDYSQVQEDLQVTGKWKDWNYTAGYYYFEDDGYTVNPIYVEVNVAPGTYLPLDFDSQYGTETEAWGGYGQVAWNPTAWEMLKPMTVTAGVRYTNETKVLDRIFGSRSCDSGDTTCHQTMPYDYLMPEGSGFSAPGTFRTPEAEFSATTPMASVGWAFTRNLNVYARYAEGFKSGGFNGEHSNIRATGGTPESNQQETSTPFRPEKQKSFEVGTKAVFLGGNAVANVAAFHNKLEDLQISIFTAEGAAASIVRNAGKATVQGVELETAWVPLEGTTLRASYAFLDPEYDEYFDEGADVADNRAFVHAPENTFNAVVDSEFFETGFGALRAVVDYVWTDKMFLYPFQLRTTNEGRANAHDTEVPAHGLLNGKLILTGIPLGGTRLGELTLWGRNMLDDDTAINAIPFGPGAFENLTVANFVEPATFGLSAQLRW